MTLWSSVSCEVAIVPALKDNYIYCLKKKTSTQVLVIDPGESKPVQKFLNKYGLQLSCILLTHHHWDHVDGTRTLSQDWPKCIVIGFCEDRHRLPPLHQTVAGEESISVAGFNIQILHIPGHTSGHIAYYFPQEDLLFSGDTIFGMGCGRLFEGTPEQMLSSLQRIAKLPRHTHIFCGHEYTKRNLGFARLVDPTNTELHQRALSLEKQSVTMPTTLDLELKTNPFFRAPNLGQFTDLRRQRDAF